MDENRKLHEFARVIVDSLNSPDKKQLRYNEIVETAKVFYSDPYQGVKELVEACDKDNSSLYSKEPMWKSLQNNYQWMLT